MINSDYKTMIIWSSKSYQIQTALSSDWLAILSPIQEEFFSLTVKHPHCMKTYRQYGSPSLSLGRKKPGSLNIYSEKFD